MRGVMHRLVNRTVLFQVGDNIFVTFGLFAAIGALLGGTLSSALLLGLGLPLLDVAVLLTAIVVSHLVLARAFLLPWRLRSLRERPGETLRTVEFASWGGYIAVAGGLVLYAVLSGRSLLGLIDAAALGGTIGHAMGRIGCLTLGCCYGKPTGSPFAICYDNPLAKAARVGGLRGVPIHPVPLYEALLVAGLFVALNALALTGSREGVPAATYLVVYGGGRFFLEFLRHNSLEDRIGPLLRNQWLSLFEAGVGVALLGALLSSSGPNSPSFADIDGEVILMLPLIVACAAFVFVAYSLHRGSIGRW
jgi:prolipoprotein diacylglyceryltransferase